MRRDKLFLRDLVGLGCEIEWWIDHRSWRADIVVEVHVPGYGTIRFVIDEDVEDRASALLPLGQIGVRREAVARGGYD